MTHAPNDDTIPEPSPVYQDKQDEVDAIERRLRDELRPAHYDLYERIDWLKNQQELETIGRLMDAIAAHFPAFAPAILAVHAHVWENGDMWACGLEVDKKTWPGFENCADATRPPRLRPMQPKKAAVS